MRKGVIGLVVLFSISLFPAYSATPPKAGSNCSKQGVTKTYQGKKFTCIKSGKKLVWSKGVVVKKPMPTPTPTPKPTPTPIPTPTFTPTPTQGSNTSPSLDSMAPLIETPCTKKNEERITNYLLICYQDRTKGLMWIRKGTEVFYKLLGSSGSLINNTDLWTPRTSKIHRQSPNPIISIPSIIGPQLGPTEIGKCKLKDLHDKTVTGPMAHGFPAEPMNPKYVKEGILKIGILPVDFLDAPGENTLKEDLTRNIAIMEDWFRYYSGGKLRLQITTSDKWIHTNKLSSAYDWKTAYPNLLWMDMANRLGQSYIDLAPANFDFSELGALLIYMPQKENKINTNFTTQSLEYSTRQGRQFVAVQAPPIRLYKFGQQPWAFWVHELMHGIGVAGHAPGGLEGILLGMMENQVGGSFSLNSWQQFILGWLPDSQVYCLAPDQASGQIVSLSPMEREDSGTKSIVIPFSDHSGLLIQAHREGKWSSKQYGYTFPENFSGVTVSLIDTRYGNYRDKPYGVDGPEFGGIVPETIAPEEQFYANFLRIDGEPSREFGCPAGLATPRGLEDTRGGACWQWTILNYVVGAVGDTYTFNDVVIQVVGSKDYEYVRITKKT